MDRLTENHIKTTAIVGGGASGVLVAAHLLRIDRQRRSILVFEDGDRLGAGVAYSTDDPRHVLNVPARSMSAFEDAPSHFVEWVRSRGPSYGPDDYVPRRLYRRYLQDVLARGGWAGSAKPRNEWLRDRVVRIDREPGPRSSAFILEVASGRRYVADDLVLATGAPRSSAVSALGLEPGPRVVTDPWAPRRLEAVAPDDVLIVGTGLTMVDVALSLVDSGRGRTVHARSRTGRLPAVHIPEGFAEFPGLDLRGAMSGREVVRRVRSALVDAEKSGSDWRNVVSAIRRDLPQTWRTLGAGEQRRLIRHLGRLWDVHRHRMAPRIAEDVERQIEKGRLTVGPGRITSVRQTTSAGRVALEVTLSSGRGHEVLHVGTLVDCSGPCADERDGDSITDYLLSQGMARPHPSGLGLVVDGRGALIDGVLGDVPRIYGIGWCRRGQRFESTAIPELRKQAADIAAQITVGNRALCGLPIERRTRSAQVDELGRGLVAS